MDSLKYFLLGLFVCFCISCSSANRVLLDSHVGHEDRPINKPVDDIDPIFETGFGFDAGSRFGVGIGVGIGGGRYGVGIGSGAGYIPGIGGGWTGPGFGGGPGPGPGCVLGYVCPSNGRGGCNNFPYGNCQPYGFFPLTTTDQHEVEINWVDKKPIEKTAQYDEYVAGEPKPPSTEAQNGV